MISFILYHPDTGEIHRSGSCEEHDLEHQHVAAPLVFLSGVNTTPREGYVLNGVVTQYTDAQRQAKRIRPPFANDWSNESFTWVPHAQLEQA